MLSPTPKTKRFLESIQLVLTFASVCAVVDASFIHSRPYERPGYYASAPQPSEREATGSSATSRASSASAAKPSSKRTAVSRACGARATAVARLHARLDVQQRGALREQAHDCGALGD